MNEALAKLYQRVIVDHHKSPRNFGPLPGATHSATVDNPLCGDQVSVHLVLDGERVSQVRFEARGCVLSRAAASLMTEAVAGRSTAGAVAIGAALEAHIQGSGPAPEPADLAVFAGVREFPSRVACVMLPWRALAEAVRLTFSR